MCPLVATLALGSDSKLGYLWKIWPTCCCFRCGRFQNFILTNLPTSMARPWWSTTLLSSLFQCSKVQEDQFHQEILFLTCSESFTSTICPLSCFYWLTQGVDKVFSLTPIWLFECCLMILGLFANQELLLLVELVILQVITSQCAPLKLDLLDFLHFHSIFFCSVTKFKLLNGLNYFNYVISWAWYIRVSAPSFNLFALLLSQMASCIYCDFYWLVVGTFNNSKFPILCTHLLVCFFKLIFVK